MRILKWLLGRTSRWPDVDIREYTPTSIRLESRIWCWGIESSTSSKPWQLIQTKGKSPEVIAKEVAVAADIIQRQINDWKPRRKELTAKFNRNLAAIDARRAKEDPANIANTRAALQAIRRKNN